MQWSYTAPAIQPENSNTLLIYQVQAASFQKSQPPEKLPKCLQTSLNQEALKHEHQIEQKRRKHIFLSTPNRYRNPLDLIRIKGRVLRISPRRLKEGKRKKIPPKHHVNSTNQADNYPQKTQIQCEGHTSLKLRLPRSHASTGNDTRGIYSQP